jgi:hypothetical protein
VKSGEGTGDLGWMVITSLLFNYETTDCRINFSYLICLIEMPVESKPCAKFIICNSCILICLFQSFGKRISKKD